MNTVFVVDDSDVNLQKIDNVLEEHFNVMTMPSAIKLFSLLESVIPDLILLDIDMPHMNGFEAIEKLKSEPKWSAIPVIFVTANTDPAIESRGLSLGAVDYIKKPFSETEFLNRIKMHLDISNIVRERTLQLGKLQNGIFSVLSNIVINSDKVSYDRLQRTSVYLKNVLDGMRKYGVFTDAFFSHYAA